MMGEENKKLKQYFPLMDLPIEVRCIIFNFLNQRSIRELRFVSKQWKKELDECYEFNVNVYDSNSSLNEVYKRRCRECTVWKLTKELQRGSLLKYPGYLKVLKVYGPISPENLKIVINESKNLEQLIFTRRANYPWVLNLDETPQLSQLTHLKYLRLNSEEQISLRNGHLNIQSPSKIPPMMDCHFPHLVSFDILKRFSHTEYSFFVTAILRFVARHANTLKKLEINLIPLSCNGLLEDPDSTPRPRAKPNTLKIDEIPSNVEKFLLGLSLKKFSITTKGSKRDLHLWKKIFETQKELDEFRFEWLIYSEEDKMIGFPWLFFKTPILNCAQTLVIVDLANLSMYADENDGNGRISGERRGIVPFNLGIFENCKSLKGLVLKCKESHGIVERREPEEEEDAEGEIQNGENVEQVLMSNVGSLPNGLEILQLYHFPIATSDLLLLGRRCFCLKKLFLFGCGKSGSLGVTAEVMKSIATIYYLKFLEINSFNDSTEENRTSLEISFQAIGLPFGRGTWLEFSNAAHSAHESMKPLLGI